MDQTPNLQLPYIMPSQAQKHVTHNEAIRALDALVQMAVLDRGLASPPLSPAEGDRYLVAAGGLAAWAGKDGDIAAWQDGAWAYFAPAAGWLVWVADEDRLLCHDGAAFVDAAVHSVNPTLLVGVNSTADATDRLSVKSPASLFDHEGGDHRMKINKETASDTASLLFQSGYSGRAEFGLTGDDDWSVKVSPDGAAWVDALKVDRATGRVRLPAGLALGDDDQIVASRHVREKLTANRTYYVRTDGSDANTGLVDSAGGAFLTIQKAIDTAAALDSAIYDVTIQIRSGTYSTATGNICKQGVGAGRIVIVGDQVTPANVVVTVSGAMTNLNGIFLSRANATVYNIRGVKLTSTGTGVVFGLCSSSGSYLEFQNVHFGAFSGAATNQHLRAEDGGVLRCTGNYTISGGASSHWECVNGTIRVQFVTITLTATPAFPLNFVTSTLGALVIVNNVAFSGLATGVRYGVATNAVLNTGGGGTTYLPGDVAGATATGGQYV